MNSGSNTQKIAGSILSALLVGMTEFLVSASKMHKQFTTVSNFKNPNLSISDLLRRAVYALHSGEWETAEESLSEVLNREPGHAAANYHLGLLALEADEPKDALHLSETGLRSEPENADLRALRRQAALRWAVLEGEKGKWAESLEALQFLDRPDAESKALEAMAHLRLGEMPACRSCYRQSMEFGDPDPMRFSQWIGLHAGDPETDAERFLTLTLEWDQRFGRPAHPLPPLAPASCGLPRNVGFVSTTLHHHANSNFLLPLLEALDPTKVRIHLYAEGALRDEVTERYRAAAHVFHETRRMGVRDVALLIRREALHLLVDINCHFDSSRMGLYTFRPAPLQAHYLGGAGPTGLGHMDWRLVDALTEPPAASGGRHGERLFRMEGGLHAYSPLASPCAPGPPPCVTRGHITFGSMNALSKMEAPVLRLWGQVLQAVPDSRLLLIKQVFEHRCNREAFRRRAGESGLPIERLDLRAPDAGAHFDDLSVYAQVDIALDTFPYNGITTTCEALWMGVPVVALRGERFVAREAAAILERSQCGDWIADSAEAYVHIATELATRPERLESLRRLIPARFRAGPVCDAPRLAREFEHFLDTVSSV